MNTHTNSEVHVRVCPVTIFSLPPSRARGKERLDVTLPPSRVFTGRYLIKHRKNLHLTLSKPIPVAARSKAWVCGLSLVGISGSNPAGGMVVSLLRVLCVVRQLCLWRADHSSRGVLPSLVCLSLILKPRQWGGVAPLGPSSQRRKKTL
jgi:hypothetical protein